MLRSFSQILEIATLKEIGNYAEEFLSYLKAAVAMEPTTAILCVQQVMIVQYFERIKGLGAIFNLFHRKIEITWGILFDSF